ncbi:MAG: hypothetical protein HWN81_10155 [Candidatus Lokiarchaeota archaeon]|nr:hypothetical protein [Candidatus Lokiarchaeota archaeon]
MSLNKEEMKILDEAIDSLEKEEDVNLKNYNAQDPEGLGDSLERVFKKFGINEEFIGKAMGIGGCGCQKRKKFLNKIFPYRKKDS